MKTVTAKILLISTILYIFTGCSSKEELISLSEAHLYDTNFGLDENIEVDEAIKEEMLAVNRPINIEAYKTDNPEWTTELTKDPDAFLEEDYVQEEPVISYKYKFDKKFYDKAEWRKADF